MRTTTEVKYNDFLVNGLFVHAVCQCCSGWLVDDSLHFESGNFAGFLRGLPLGVVEVGRNRDDRPSDLCTQVIFGRFLHFLKGHGADFLRGIHAVVDFHTWRVVVSFDHLIRHPRSFFFHLVE